MSVFLSQFHHLNKSFLYLLFYVVPTSRLVEYGFWFLPKLYIASISILFTIPPSPANNNGHLSTNSQVQHSWRLNSMFEGIAVDVYVFYYQLKI